MYINIIYFQMHKEGDVDENFSFEFVVNKSIISYLKSKNLISQCKH